MEKRRRILTVIFIMIMTVSVTVFGAENAKNVIFFIGDGMGMSAIDMSRIALAGKENRLEFEKAPYIGLQKTYSANSLVTDSAAGGTALATGHKTNNAAVGVDDKGRNVINLVEASKVAGKSTGVVTTVTITHATPGVFGGHTLSRDELPLADEYALYKSADIYMGGGRIYFTPQSEAGSKRRDDRNLIDEFKKAGYNYVSNKNELKEIKEGKVLGLFAEEYLPFVIDREHLKADVPELSEMVAKSIELLKKNEKGFFLMVEAGKIDWAAHDNDAGALIREVEELNKAVSVAVDFMKEDKNTLIIVTADHETGGIGMGIGEYSINPVLLKKQKISAREIAKLIEGKNDEEIKKVFKEYAGITRVPAKELEKIKKYYDKTDIGRFLGSIAEIGFTTMEHSGQSVPVYAFGKGSEMFAGVYENTDIPLKISALTGVSLEEK